RGLVDFDQGQGWRGPVAHFDDLGADWGLKVAEVKALTDVVEWQLAIVTAVSPEGAEIGLQPGRDPGTDAVAKARETGFIPFAQMKWVKRVVGQKKGVNGADDVVRVGDVV